MKDENLNLICVILIMILGCGVLFFNLYNITDVGGQFYVGTTIRIVLSVLVAYLLVKCCRKGSLYILCLVIAVGSFFWATQIPVFSPIDEGAHFAYVNYICENNKLPLVMNIMDGNMLSTITDKSIPSGIMYEAVHPPVYYVMVAVVCKMFSSVVVRFWICRAIGCLILVSIAAVIFSWCKYVNQIGLVNEDKKENLLVCALAILCLPGVLTRFATVSNEGLAVLFVCLILFELTKIVFSGLTWKRILKVNLLIILAFLTKITTAFVIVLWIIVLLYYKKYKMAVLTGIIIGGGISPWFIYNYINYGALTATKEHLSYVLPIVNPNKKPLDIVSGVNNIFYHFVYPQEGIASELTKPIIYFMNIFILLILILSLVTALKKIWRLVVKEKCCFKYTEEEKKNIIEVVYSFCILGNILILVLGSIGTYVSVIIGRYLYLSFIPIIYLIFLYAENSLQKQIYRIGTVFICILCLENILIYMSPALSKLVGVMCEYDNVDVNNIVSYDVIIENGTIISGTVDPQVTFLDELSEKYRVVDFEVELLNNSSATFVMYYAVDGIFTEENKIVSDFDVQKSRVRFLIGAEVDISNIRIDPPSGSSIIIREIKVYK